MTAKEIKILSYIRDNAPVSWIEVLNTFYENEKLRENEAILKKALSEGLIETTWKAEKPPLCSIRLSSKGIVALMAEEEHRNQLAKQPNVDQEQNKNYELKKRKVNWSKVFATLISIFGLIASFVAILEFVISILC